MAAKIKKYLRALGAFLRIYSRSLTEYRAEFAFGNIFMFLTNSIFYFTLVYLAHRFGTFGGLSADEVTAALAISFLGFLVGGNFFSGTRKIAVKIIKGNFDTMLLRPLPIFLQAQLIEINKNAIGEIAFGIFFAFFVEPSFWPRIIFFGITGGIILNVWNYCINLLSIYTEIDHSRGGFDAFINLKLYPTKIFDPVTRFIAITIIPGGLMSFMPIYMIHEPYLAWIYGSLFVFLIVFTFIFSKYSLKKYTGAS